MTASVLKLHKGISPKICILCVRVKINKRSFEPFCVRVVSFTIVSLSMCKILPHLDLSIMIQLH